MLTQSPDHHDKHCACTAEKKRHRITIRHGARTDRRACHAYPSRAICSGSRPRGFPRQSGYRIPSFKVHVPSCQPVPLYLLSMEKCLFDKNFSHGRFTPACHSAIRPGLHFHHATLIHASAAAERMIISSALDQCETYLAFQS